MLGAVAPLAKILFSTIEKSVPDKDLQEKLKSQLQTQLLQSNTQELTAAAKIIEAEAKAGWFASSWRPLLMYVLIFILIWNYVLGPVILFFFKDLMKSSYFLLVSYKRICDFLYFLFFESEYF